MPRSSHPYLTEACMRSSLGVAIDAARRCFMLDLHGIHGDRHWRSVAFRGQMLANLAGSDPYVVTLFSILHDSCRVSDGCDELHGRRSAALAERMVDGGLIAVSESQAESLVTACMVHNEAFAYRDSADIGVCLDADRLDLTRVGIEPCQDRLYSCDEDVSLVRGLADRDVANGDIPDWDSLAETCIHLYFARYAKRLAYKTGGGECHKKTRT